MTDLYALFGAKPHVLKLRSNALEELMQMDVKNTIHVLKDPLTMTTNSAQDTARLNVISNMNISALNHQQMGVLSHQPAKQRKQPIKVNFVTNNTVN